MEEDKDIKSIDQIKAEAEPDIEILSLRRQVDSLKTEVKKMQADYGDLKGYFHDLDSVALHMQIPPVKILYNPLSEDKKVKSPCTAVMQWCDWHYGAVQGAEELEFMEGAFSPEIAEARITQLNSDFVKWVEVLRSGYNIDELVIIDVGDNISGDIHDELKITNAFPTPVQAFNCGVFKGGAICSLAQYFKKVTVHFLVPDNHSRLTKIPQAKQSGLNSHNYTVGHVTDLVCGKQPNVDFNIYYSYTKTVEVANRIYLLTHGHGIKGWSGFPYYGAERFVSREALVRLQEPEFNRFHKCLMGHFHAPLWHPWYWIGGSVSGTDSYDRQAGRRSKPMQTAWIIHPRKGEFNKTEFELKP